MTALPEALVKAVRAECNRRTPYSHCLFEAVKPGPTVAGITCSCSWVAEFTAHFRSLIDAALPLKPPEQA